MCIFYVSFLREHKIIAKKIHVFWLGISASLPFSLTTSILSYQIMKYFLYKNVFDGY